MKELAYLNKYLLKYKYHLALGTVFVVISNIFLIIPAPVVRYVLDFVREGKYLHDMYGGMFIQNKVYGIIAINILIFGAIILAMVLLRGFFIFMMRQTIIVASRLIEYDFKNEIYAHYQTLPLSFYKKNNTGDLMARISEDVSRVRMYLGPAIMYSINITTLFLLTIPYMFSINAKLSFYALIPLPVLSVSIYFVSNLMNKRSAEIQKSLSGLSTFVQEAFSGIRVIKAYAREGDSADKFYKASNDFKDKSLKLTFVNALFFPLMTGLIGLSVILTVYIGGTEVINGSSISVGNIAEFIMYVNILTWPVASLGWVTSLVQRAAASQKRINEFLKQKSDIISKENIRLDLEGHIAFNHVSFTYPDSGIEALKDVSFKIKPGERMAIIGTTGSGKSTIANLLCRMYDVSSGTIMLDKHDIKSLNITHMRSQMGYVPQDVFLFSDTIKNNIAFGSMEVSEERIIAASKDADLYENVQSFSDGFHTKIGERGITLSGGQKQRVSIARAIIRDPKILILDDCLSAVDTKTENTVLNNLKKIMTDKTTLVISHRVSSAKLADTILVLNEGKIIEQGTHEFLLNNNGFYKDLYDRQLKNEELV